MKQDAADIAHQASRNQGLLRIVRFLLLGLGGRRLGSRLAHPSAADAKRRRPGRSPFHTCGLTDRGGIKC